MSSQRATLNNHTRLVGTKERADEIWYLHGYSTPWIQGPKPMGLMHTQSVDKQMANRPKRNRESAVGVQATGLSKEPLSAQRDGDTDGVALKPHRDEEVK